MQYAYKKRYGKNTQVKHYLSAVIIGPLYVRFCSAVGRRHKVIYIENQMQRYFLLFFNDIQIKVAKLRGAEEPHLTSNE